MAFKGYIRIIPVAKKMGLHVGWDICCAKDGFRGGIQLAFWKRVI
jgi:hypothetical protein